MIFELNKVTAGVDIGRKFTAQAASSLGLREKAIENWIASDPDMLFQAEDLLVIGQSISGRRMADVLALDASGGLVVVEVKRDPSDRETIGQLLEYAASMDGSAYERLDQIAQDYAQWEGGSLIDRFREFADRPDFPRDKLGERSRVLIVAPEADQGLRSIVDWLSSFSVPIAFIPFSIFADDKGEPRLLQIDSAPLLSLPTSETEGWMGHWIFNTNEKNAPGAWERMFSRDIAAIYGYAKRSQEPRRC